MNAHLRPAAAPLRRSLRVLTFPTIRRKHPWVFRWLFAAPRVLVGWLMFSALVLPYGLIRAVGDDTALPHWQGVMLHVDRVIGLGTTPTQHLQGWLFHGSYSWYDWLFVGAYVSYFFTPLILVPFILAVKPHLFGSMLLMLGVLYYSASLSFVLLPTEPPWMALHMTRIVTVWYTSPIKADPNPLAAFPSLHAGTIVAIALWFRSVKEHRLAMLFSVQAALVAFAVVYFGEHYVVDVVAGGAFAVAAVLIASRIEARVNELTRWLSRTAREALSQRRSGAAPIAGADDLR